MNDQLISDHYGNLVLLTGSALLPPAASDAQRLEAGKSSHRQRWGDADLILTLLLVHGRVLDHKPLPTGDQDC